VVVRAVDVNGHPTSSHLLVFERPDQVQRAVREFLDSGGVVETLWPIRRGP